jgi:1-deoxy-D-xylulose-5-phosphate synthase
MIIETINSPADLKGLDDEQLVTLAAEMRQLIVDSVTTHGGHLGSNLGVVELTLAIHRVFDSPNDIILWDTGHQTYPHKIVTGRTGGFDSLREAGGLSGYPSRKESEHDWIENSHASTVLSWAYGLSVAQASSDGPDRRIVAVIGDGSMTGGMAFEGLNNLGHSGRDCIIILNDNGRSYAPTVSRLGESLVKIRNNPVYMRRQAKLERLLADIPVLGGLAKSGIDATKAAIREMWEPTAFFEALGVRYAGPFDGHDIGELEEALHNATAMRGGPQVIHVLTQKGRGYGPAENDPIKRLHDTSESKPGSFTAAFTEALVKEGEARPELVAITAAMPDSTGLLPFAERFPGRMFDVGIAEQHAVAAAAGMAAGGLRPVVAVYSTFLTRAFDQVNLDVGLHGQPVVFCLDRAGITGDDGPSHHGILDMVLLTKVPGMTVFAPSSYQEVGQMLHDALEITDGPVSIRWAKTAARQSGPEDVGHGLNARRLREGTDLCIISVGKMIDAAEAAADLLASEGVSVSLWDARVVKPLDTVMIDDAARHPYVLTIEDGLRLGGVGMAIADLVSERTVGHTEPRVRVLGIPDRYLAHGKPDAILADVGLDAPGITAAALSMMSAGDPERASL